LSKILKRAMQLHDLRVGWRGKNIFKGALNTSRSRAINHEIKNIKRKRGQQSTKDELVLLFPSQKRLGRARIEGNRGGRNHTRQITQRGAWS